MERPLPALSVPASETTAMQNLLLEPIDYKIEETPLGTWRRFAGANGMVYSEFTSRHRWFGLPLLAYTSGRCPETGKAKMAKGIIAVGRFALGVVAIGQVAIGLFPIGQVSLGLVLGLGQFATGLVAVGQFALGGVFGFGQFATGLVAIGQFALGWHVVGQIGMGAHVWKWHQLPEFLRHLMAP
jgi:hypothetical protein